MTKLERKTWFYKNLAVFTVFVMVTNIIFPTIAYSNSGPYDQYASQSPSGSSAVDPFTGSFAYSIPLMNVEGFPISISYNDDIRMHQEASWVGLGWSLNLGSINRQKRGLPDDFDGDEIVQTVSRKKESTDGLAKGFNVNVGLNFGFSIGILGVGVGLNVGGSYLKGKFENSYKGYGEYVKNDISASLVGSIGAFGLNANGGFFGAYGRDKNTQNGIGFNTNSGVTGSVTIPGATLAGGVAGGGKQVNTRQGTKVRNQFTSFTLIGKGTTSRMTSRNLGFPAFTPKLSADFIGTSETFLKGRGAFIGIQIPLNFSSGLDDPSLGVRLEAGGLREWNWNRFHLKDKTVRTKGYGYLNLQNHIDADVSLLDFNREKEMEVSPDAKMLPGGNMTYDLFQVSGPGIGGVFRAHRNDIGTVGDPNRRIHTESVNKTDKKAFGIWYKHLLQNGITYMDVYAGKGDGIAGDDRFRFKKQEGDVNNRNFEPAYFKFSGEMTPNNTYLEDNLGGVDPIRLHYTASNGYLNESPFFTKNNDLAGVQSIGIPVTTHKNVNEREIRANYIKKYTAKELVDMNFSSSFENYTALNDGQAFNGYQSTSIIRNSDYRKDHHLSMIDVITTNGATYRYGLPVYSIEENEVNFAVSKGPQSILDWSKRFTEGTVEYEPNIDNSIDNKRGKDNHFEKTLTPSYSSAFLLTSVLSSNYVDVDNNGPSIEDIGSYVKLNYSMQYGGSGNEFKWRFPYSEKPVSEPGYPKASYQEGMKSDLYDDKAHYNYGKKEIWYVHTIETKNYIAEFYLDDRYDAYSNNDENGQLLTNENLKCLKKIVLYNREDRLRNEDEATPLKTVEFIYDHSLCPGFPGNVTQTDGGGKLTLKKIIFKSGNSQEFAQNPYEFVYGGENYPYGSLDVNRWGFYKENSTLNGLHNSRFPYVGYDESELQTTCTAWKLTKIKQPSGGEMDIEYEPNRFSNIQDQRTMKMFNVIGFNTLEMHESLNEPNKFTDAIPPYCHANLRDTPKKPRNVLYFKLEEPINEGTYSASLKKMKYDYFNMTDNSPSVPDIYYNFDVQIAGNSNDHEHMNGWLSHEEIEEFGLVGRTSSNPNDPYYYGYIELRERSIGHGDNEEAYDFSVNHHHYDFNLLQKLFIQYVRVNLPEKIYSYTPIPNNNGEPIYFYHNNYDGKTLGANPATFLHNLNKDQYCQFFLPNSSFIRLYNPTNIEYTGGARVAKITTNDKWQDMSGEYDGVYSMKYNYEVPNQKSLNNNMPTNGVSSYDPMDGHDLSPFFQPEYFTLNHFYIPNDRKYQLKIMGESHLPAPLVGHHHVEKELIDQPNQSITATGKTVLDFYTSLDEKCKYRFLKTDPQIMQADDQDVQASKSVNSYAFSQGYTVLVNDFHGKIREVKSIDENGIEISRTQYEYFDIDDEQNVVLEDGSIIQANLGREVDIIVDKNRTYNEVDVSSKSKALSVGLIPIPSWSETDTEIKVEEILDWSVVTKVVFDYAKIKKVTTSSIGNQYDSEVVAYDAKSAEPIALSSLSEYNDRTYGIALPAYWKYKQLAPIYSKDDLEFKNVSISSNGEFTVSTDIDKFSVGDQLQISYPGQNQLDFAHVIEIVPSTNTIRLIDEAGLEFNPIQTNANVQIKFAGNKNRLNESMMSVGQIGTNPIGSILTIDEDNILSSEATFYNYNKGLICQKDINCDGVIEACGIDPTQPINPFLFGLYSNIYPTQSFVYQGSLNNSLALSDPNLILDGKYESFEPFYKISGGNWYAIDESAHPDFDPTDAYQNWRAIGDVTRWDEFGRVLETVDPLERHSAIIYGYNSANRLIPIATSYNAKINQIAFDGMEDYSYFDFETNCNKKPHFSFKDAVGSFSIVENEHHTGRYSIEVSPGSEASVKRGVGLAFPHKKGDPLLDGNGLFSVTVSECNPNFSPEAGEYWVSIWTKELVDSPDDYQNVSLEIKCYSGGTQIGTTQTLYPKGSIIDDWQKIEGKVLVEQGADCIEIKLVNASTNSAYFDDFRFHPYKATMVSAVFDQRYLLPMATLNSNNYATIFHYDENLSLARIMKETTDGKQTVAEFKGGLKKNNY